MKTKNEAADVQRSEGRDIGNILSAVVLTTGFIALILFAIFGKF
ncbi:hypothetical protein [Panacibacter ginsenosidivorans]|jgi:hypothetical protein|nr:hypothetical protein [Panacibacter ginsenosidivorans]